MRRDPTKPRAIEVRYDTNSGIAIDRRPARHVPLVGEVAAGTDVPEDAQRIAADRLSQASRTPEARNSASLGAQDVPHLGFPARATMM